MDFLFDMFRDRAGPLVLIYKIALMLGVTITMLGIYAAMVWGSVMVVQLVCQLSRS